MGRGQPEPLRDPVRIARAYRRMLGVISSGADLPRIADTAARLASELLRADGATVTQMRDDYLEYVAATGVASGLDGRTLRVEDSFTGRAASSGKPLVFDPRTADEGSRERAQEHDIRSGIVCPILIGGRVAGTIGAVSHRESSFGEDAIARLDELAEFLALGLERNRSRRRLERTHHHYRMSRLAQFVVDELEPSMGRLMTHLRELTDTLDARGVLAPTFDELEHVTRVLEDLRVFADDDPGGPAPVPVRLAEILERLTRHFGDRIGAVAELDVRPPRRDLAVLAVPSRMWQIAYALVMNAVEAIEATPRGMHRVSVYCRSAPFAVDFVVEDTGCGIPTDELSLVFEPFYSTKRTGERRAGLGLALVWRYVSTLGGTIDVDSEPGRGSRFTVRLPRVPIEDRDEDSACDDPDHEPEAP